MSRILLPSDFQNGDLPEKQDFYAIKHKLGTFLHNHEQVEFGTFFGSFSRNEHTFLSDVDLFVVYSGKTHRFMGDLRKFIQREIAHLSIPVEMLVYKKDHLERGLHDLRGSIFHEVKYSSKVGCFAGEFDFGTIRRPVEPLAGFFSSKHKGRFKDYPFLEFDLENNGKEVASYLQKLGQTFVPMLEKALDQNNQLPEKALGKKEVVKLYREVFGNATLERYREIYAILETIEGIALSYLDNEDLYEEVLKEFFNLTPMVLEFLEDIEYESCNF